MSKQENSCEKLQKKMGRPSKYTDELALEICNRVAGGRTLSEVSKDEDMPAQSTIYKWRVENEHFSELYTRARQCLVEFWIDQVITIGDDATHDTITKTSKSGDEYEAVNHEWLGRSRLMCDNRKWLASKIAPKLYGDKQTVTHEAPSGFSFTMKPPKGE